MAGWKDALRNVAPALGKAFGGPIGGAIGIVSQVLLGKPDAKESEIEAALAKATPEQLLELRKADQAFAEKMKGLDIDLERIDAEDRASARARQIATRDHTPTVLAFIILGAYVSLQFWILTHTVPEASEPLIMRALGILDGITMTVVAFYFGSSRGSRTKDEALAKAATQE